LIIVFTPDATESVALIVEDWPSEIRVLSTEIVTVGVTIFEVLPKINLLATADALPDFDNLDELTLRNKGLLGVPDVKPTV
jgi:hypothetical protein